jgi:hypothetical protein
MGHYIMFYSDDGESPNSHGISSQSTAEKRLFRYAVARFACYPIVLWDTGIDIAETRSSSWVTWFVDYFNTNDPWKHPSSSRGPHAGYPIPSNALYYSDGDRVLPTHSTVVSRWKSRSVPTVYADRWRENYASPFDGGRDKIRRAVWEVGLVGGTGVYVSGNDNGGYLTSNYASDFQAASDCGKRSEFFRDHIIDFGKLYPHSELVKSGNVILSADPDKEYVGYLGSGGACTIDLSAVSGTVTLKYYNPISGALSSGTPLSASASTAIPAPSFSGDAVIWIVAQGVQDNTPPSNVDGLGATANGQTISLAWNAATDNESSISGYEIFRGRSSNPTALLATVENVTTYQDNTGAEGTAFYYRVKAINGAGLKSANYSNEASATTAADTQKPAIASVAAGSATSVSVVFSEKVEKLSAENSANYGIDNSISVSNAVLQADEISVMLTISAMTEDATYTLTVNNVKDRAMTPNTIEANSQKTFTYAGQLVLTSPTVSSGKIYIWDTMANGKEVYIDRAYTFSTVPAEYSGLQYLKTANDDKAVSGNPLISFNTNQNVTVHVGYAGSSLPSWLSGWNNTGDVIETTDRNMAVYVKEFPAGTVTLGDNGSAASMYTVIVAKAGGPTVEAGRLDGVLDNNVCLTARPNPFNAAVNIVVRGAAYGARRINVQVYNINGKLIASLWSRASRRTPDTITWNPATAPAGVYIAKLNTGTTRLTKKLYLMK